MTNGERLDSWKAISAYLNRNERTVRRWEKDFGLPVRRVSAGRGHSVFALKSEIDEWLLKRGQMPESAETVSDSAPVMPPALRRHPAVVPAVLGVVVLVLAATWWLSGRANANGMPARVNLTPSAIVALDAEGLERWRHDFKGERVEVPNERMRHSVDVLESEPKALVTATAWQISARTEAVRSGEVLSFSPTGTLAHSFALNDRLMFGEGEFAGPWGINDFRVTEAGTRRVAVAGHHLQWWPGFVAVLDADLRRRGIFVNAGWLERVHWLSNDRLVISGYSNAHEGGVIALLDAAVLDGQSPEAPDSPYYCRTCGAGRPVRYVVMPRSELNRMTGSKFNRARFEVHGTAIMARTYEMQLSETDAVDALYEFTPALDLVSASFSERYWDEHRVLEMQGKIAHTRANCPERDGPRQMEIWEPATGWRTVQIR